jgi:hypothetical protein
MAAEPGVKVAPSFALEASTFERLATSDIAMGSVIDPPPPDAACVVAVALLDAGDSPPEFNAVTTK